ncbi:hypothetical protein I307_02339 [Cryptococcus deuterogattii 99/473]|uniref:Urease accessory protein UreF n=2 Tax=Cryptococcus deuterogattii TaxID=1859096 RepID=A0A0D0V0A6_9TREE|nr:hypothetical protein CNBG_5207 [Cryptococcus deuterogattii R265]KIR28939.1 hypothetical protein I309_01980 [Cryptococcus deuterogattii LA55]KIR38330.1 hypothetical protein I313_05904 [Cryptococcus deuterogattii Ram5]KIR73532.1 hypothetical protein I310_02203 [Cryptococcus deuterogattii CA1014]KIR93021.1 hypothetical protein I304_02683 [Cryptococcus deuterogattii CBS 10090]KIR99715.1 hypothetical protein L804_03348 [Cryptococcus deuterogattii 2001/935-1]KIY58092.1 hypothetical protein I307_
MASSSPPAEELHLLYVLTDSNLPTGGFVSSSGLESFAKHGFLSSQYSYTNRESKDGIRGKKNMTGGLVDFARAEVSNYASTTGGFVKDAWSCVADSRKAFKAGNGIIGEEVQRVLQKIQVLDKYHECTLLSHVGRRSSKAQGVAMLTLFSRGLSRPAGIDEYLSEDGGGPGSTDEMGLKIVEGYKKMVILEKAPGHLAVCWGVITAALGLPVDRALHLHLFLHARSLLSSAVRLNIIGPYASSQLLLHPYRDIIDQEVNKLHSCTTGIIEDKAEKNGKEEDFWAWTEDAEKGPATTWPLGEVLMGRHDIQHSRIFNS